MSAYGYDARGRLDSLSHTLGANPSFASFGYTYNPVGNILAILDQVNPSENRTHSYDALQRLTTGGTVANAESYAYDLVGNRTTSSVSSTHTHDDLNRLLEDDQFTYTYDDNGNLETKTDKGNPTQITTYHWDAQDKLIQIDRPSSTTVRYKYDGLGRRIEKDVAGTVTRYVYDGEDILLEFDGTNTFVARYSHGQQVDQPLILQKAGIGHVYYHSNHQGSISHLTNNSGAIINTYVYDSFGKQVSVMETVIQPYSYTGREYDIETGLYFYRARYYDANAGRFLSEDPIGFGGGNANFYIYGLVNPLTYIDPFGLAYFALRPFGPTPSWLAEGPGTNSILDYLNLELAHEHIFYEDGNLPSNEGFFGDEGAFNEPGTVRPDDPTNLEEYWRADPKTYDDALLRQAVENVGAGNYCLFGSNCQDWADKVREEYKRLEEEQNRKDEQPCP